MKGPHGRQGQDGYGGNGSMRGAKYSQRHSLQSPARSLRLTHLRHCHLSLCFGLEIHVIVWGLIHEFVWGLMCVVMLASISGLVTYVCLGSDLCN